MNIKFKNKKEYNNIIKLSIYCLLKLVRFARCIIII